MTLKVIRLLQDLSNAIRRTFVRHLARFELTRRVARSLELLVKTHYASPWLMLTRYG